MRSQGFDEFFHGHQAAFHRPRAPGSQVFAGMVHADVTPEDVEAFFDLIRSHGFKVVAQEIFEPDLLVVCQGGAALEKAVSRFFENGFVAFLGEFFGFLFAHFVNCLVEFFGNVKAIQDVEG